MKKKTKSQRGKSGKKPGAQQGHPGKGLAQISNPDLIVTHTPTNCLGCGSNLGQADGTCAETRQVFEKALSTARKQGWNIWDALAEAIRGCPRLLAVHQETVLQAIAV